MKTAIASLEQQISCMEDELSESRLESSRLKTELVSEKSAAEIKLSELTSKINEVSFRKEVYGQGIITYYYIFVYSHAVSHITYR